MSESVWERVRMCVCVWVTMRIHQSMKKFLRTHTNKSPNAILFCFLQTFHQINCFECFIILKAQSKVEEKKTRKME